MEFEARHSAARVVLTVDLRSLSEREPNHLPLLLKIKFRASVLAVLATVDSAHQAFRLGQTVRPPSTGNSTPVMNDASSLPR